MNQQLLLLLNFTQHSMAYYTVRQEHSEETVLHVFCTEAEFLDEIHPKVLRVFLLAIHSHLYRFALRFLFLQAHTTSYSFYSALLTYCTL
jgi:hypothetical protein